MSTRDYESHPVKSDIRDKLLADLAKLALSGGQIKLEDVVVEVEIEE